MVNLPPFSGQAGECFPFPKNKGKVVYIWIIPIKILGNNFDKMCVNQRKH
jgi:hypothetical protein